MQGSAQLETWRDNRAQDGNARPGDTESMRPEYNPCSSAAPMAGFDPTISSENSSYEADSNYKTNNQIVFLYLGGPSQMPGSKRLEIILHHGG